MRVEALEIVADYIPIFVLSKPTLPVHYIVQQFEGLTSPELPNRYEYLRKKLPTLWWRGYYVGGVGFVSDRVVKN